MLNLKFPGAIFTSLLLVLITIPAVSFKPISNDGISQKFTDSGSAPKTPLNKHAAVFMKKYLKVNADCLDAVREKSPAPFAIIDGVFTKYDLPVELKYLAVVESELNPKALSRVGAAGPWQLMPGTAKDLGLKVTRKNDERKNFKKSTQAAALYLRDLYRQYDDWLLVLAAYNCGPVPVNAAIRKSGSRNFWKLQYHLPAESRDHVKKFIATHYYFEGEGSMTTLTKSETVTYTKTIDTWTANQEKSGNAARIAAENNSDTATKKTVAMN